MGKNNHFFIYPEDKKGKRTGHTICVLLGLDRDGSSRVYYGIALCSNKDQFSYKEGRKLSLERAEIAQEKRLS